MAHILRKNYLLIHVAEGKIEVRVEMAGRQGKRRKQLLDYLRETRGYWNLKEEALDRTVWRTRLGRGWTCRKTDHGMNECVGVEWIHVAHDMSPLRTYVNMIKERRVSLKAGQLICCQLLQKNSAPCCEL